MKARDACLVFVLAIALASNVTTRDWDSVFWVLTTALWALIAIKNERRAERLADDLREYRALLYKAAEIFARWSRKTN